MPYKLIAILLLSATTAFAQTGAYKAEYERLEKDYEAATRQALDPIQQRHAAALQQLIRKASQAGDLETAVKAKEALDSVTAAPAAPQGPRSTVPGSGKKEALKVKLSGTTWTIYEGGKQLDTVTFKADGTCDGRWKGKWEVTSATVVKIHNGGQAAEGTFNEKTNEIGVPSWNRVLRKQ